MSLGTLIAIVSNLNKLDPLIDRIQGFTRRKLDELPEQVEEAIHGESLERPLHSTVVVAPIATLTTAVALDAVAAVKDSEALEKAADVALAAGLLTALPVAVIGLADWARLENEDDKRLGLLHASANKIGLITMGAGYVVRRRGDRVKGRRLALLGFGVLAVGAALGSTLARRMR